MRGRFLLTQHCLLTQSDIPESSKDSRECAAMKQCSETMNTTGSCLSHQRYEPIFWWVGNSEGRETEKPWLTVWLKNKEGYISLKRRNPEERKTNLQQEPKADNSARPYRTKMFHQKMQCGWNWQQPMLPRGESKGNGAKGFSQTQKPGDGHVLPQLSTSSSKQTSIYHWSSFLRKSEIIVDSRADVESEDSIIIHHYSTFILKQNSPT